MICIRGGFLSPVSTPDTGYLLDPDIFYLKNKSVAALAALHHHTAIN